MQQLRLNSTSLLMCSLQMNQLIGNMEVASGLLPASDEDKELEDDDGNIDAWDVMGLTAACPRRTV